MSKAMFRRMAIVDETHRSSKSSSFLKIGEVAKLSGIGIESLRFYEKSGLLDKPVRTGSNYRLYGKMF